MMRSLAIALVMLWPGGIASANPHEPTWTPPDHDGLLPPLGVPTRHDDSGAVPPCRSRGEGPSRLMITTTALAAGSVIALAAGVGFSMWGRDLSNQREHLCPSDGCEVNAEFFAKADAIDRKGRTANLGAEISYAAAAVLAIGGAVAYAIDRTTRSPIAAAPVPGGAMVVAGAAF